MQDIVLLFKCHKQHPQVLIHRRSCSCLNDPAEREREREREKAKDFKNIYIFI